MNEKPFPPPDSHPAICLYKGKVMHARLKPKQHRFSYSVFSIFVDLDQLAEAACQSRIFSVNQGNLVSFHERDHADKSGTGLRDQINALLAKGGFERPKNIRLWCNPRVLGYTFNPLSVYYCYDADDRLTALVYQVHNTFGESHSYIAKIDMAERLAGCIRQSADKRFHVSPFLDMDLRYDFRIHPPDDRLKIRILEHDATGPILAATFSGKKRLLNTSNLLLGIGQTLGLTWKIMAGIHFEALRLWLKGVAVKPKPPPPYAPTYLKKEPDTLTEEK